MLKDIPTLLQQILMIL